MKEKLYQLGEWLGKDNKYLRYKILLYLAILFVGIPYLVIWLREQLSVIDFGMNFLGDILEILLAAFVVLFFGYCLIAPLIKKRHHS